MAVNTVLMQYALYPSPSLCRLNESISRSWQSHGLGFRPEDSALDMWTLDNIDVLFSNEEQLLGTSPHPTGYAANPNATMCALKLN